MRPQGAEVMPQRVATWLGGRHVALVGAMGTGKSTLAPLLADSLARPWVDLDAAIEADAGATVAELFIAEGEAGFRRREAAVLAALLEGAPSIIACGGGAVLDPDSRARLAARAFVLGLWAPPEVLAGRVAGDAGRPLAADAAGLAALLRERRAALAVACDAVIAAVAPPGAVAQAALATLAAAAGWRRAPAAAGLEGWIGGAGCVAAALPQIAALASGRLAVVADAEVMALYGAWIGDALSGLGCAVERHVIDGREASKTLETWAALTRALVAGGASRDLLVVAIGGGVVCDIAGFAAATALRGVRHVLVPTTLLAQVDAAIGGKTGVDTEAGKNLVGAFYPAALVVCDGDTLATLPKARLGEGVAELCKTALVADAGLWDAVEAALPALGRCCGVGGAASEADRRALAELAARAAAAKREVVRLDPREAGARRSLNFGHTLGHALERTHGYGVIAHGAAVAIGMRYALDLGVELGVTPSALRQRVLAALGACGLPIELPAPVSIDALLAALTHDKKADGDAVRWILLEAPGRWVERRLTVAEARAVLWR